MFQLLENLVLLLLYKLIGCVRAVVENDGREPKWFAGVKTDALIVLSSATMSSPYLLAELLDYVVEFLCDSSDALNSCCLVSKPWIPRTRKYIFADIKFSTTKDLLSWKAMFPNPSLSPACYAKSLTMSTPDASWAARAQGGRWLSAFSRVSHFEINITNYLLLAIPLLQFHGFSPALKSLRISSNGITPLRIFHLVCSFPLLEDISVTILDPALADSDDNFNEQPTVVQPSSSLRFTGSLELSVYPGMQLVTPRLLSLPNGLHFRNLRLIWRRTTDVSPTATLVGECSLTLESLRIDGGYCGTLVLDVCLLRDSSLSVGPPLGRVDLSNATKLREVELLCYQCPRWALETLQTITRNHGKLRRVTVGTTVPAGINDREELRRVAGETVYRQWLALDHLLARLRESQSVRLGIICYLFPGLKEMGGDSRMKVLLPEVMMGGVVDLV